MRRVLACFLIATAAMVSTSALAAEPPDKGRAKEAYDRGLEAHKRGDKHKAAEEFARADSLAPSSVALQAALDAAIEADDAALGVELLERSKARGGATPGLASSVTAAHMKFSNRAGVVARSSSDDPSSVEPEPATQKDKRGVLERGFPPIIFYAGVGVTVVLAGVTAIFALSTASSHDKFNAAGCEKSNFEPCNGLKDSGESSQTATNVALVSTALVGIGTAAIGLFLTNWKGPLVSVRPGGGEAVWRVSF